MSAEFDSRVTKGRIGERIVDDWLVRKGFVPYRPIEGVAHPFDRLVASRDKRTIRVVEVKSKPRRERYPDTGISVGHFQDYRHIEDTYNVPVFIAFVDERLKKVYGNFLSELCKSNGRYPLVQSGIIYFPLCHMKRLADLTEEQCVELEALRRSRYISNG